MGQSTITLKDCGLPRRIIKGFKVPFAGKGTDCEQATDVHGCHPI
jgi:hypothetical protein